MKFYKDYIYISYIVFITQSFTLISIKILNLKNFLFFVGCLLPIRYFFQFLQFFFYSIYLIFLRFLSILIIILQYFNELNFNIHFSLPSLH